MDEKKGNSEKSAEAKAKAKPEVKEKPKPTYGKVADVLVEVCLKEGKIKDRKTLAEKTVKVFKERYNGRHKRGEVRYEKVLQQIGALFKCFTNWDGKGNARKGWWQGYTVDETDGIVLTKVTKA